MRGITFGAFDPLHYGHTRLFSRAKKMCDELVVSIAGDDYIRNVKKREPCVPLEGRMELMGELKMVDIVDCHTKKKPLIEKYKPDLIFVGDDWTPKTFTGEGLGVKVIYLPYTSGISSTQIRWSQQF